MFSQPIYAVHLGVPVLGLPGPRGTGHLLFNLARQPCQWQHLPSHVVAPGYLFEGLLEKMLDFIGGVCCRGRGKRGGWGEGVLFSFPFFFFFPSPSSSPPFSSPPPLPSPFLPSPPFPFFPFLFFSSWLGSGCQFLIFLLLFSLGCGSRGRRPFSSSVIPTSGLGINL